MIFSLHLIDSTDTRSSYASLSLPYCFKTLISSCFSDLSILSLYRLTELLVNICVDEKSHLLTKARGSDSDYCNPAILFNIQFYTV